jgi:hypothetical protein
MVEAAALSESEERQTPDNDFGSRVALAQDADMGAPPRATDRSELGAQTREELAKFGVQVREANGRYEYFYRANGQDNLVAQSAATAIGLTKGLQSVQDFTAARIANLEKTYKVTFAKPGEEADNTYERQENCKMTRGEMTYASQPTLPQIYAVEEALKRSRPSQMTADGKNGMKIYFLDRQIMPQPIYGDKYALGIMVDEDKDGRRALMMTPDGGKLPPTARDMPGIDPTNERNLAWGIVHEITHNSQVNYWTDDMRVPKFVSEGLGWDTLTYEYGDGKHFDVHRLKGKNGELYINTRLDGCHGNPVWISMNKDGQLLGANGEVVKDNVDAAQFSNEQVMDLAQVRPPTYYFGNPKEMLSEGLTAYRSGRETRAKLFREAPEVYAVAATYDEREIAHYYGRNPSGETTHVRTPEGYIVEREPATITSIREFESRLRRAS